MSKHPCRCLNCLDSWLYLGLLVGLCWPQSEIEVEPVSYVVRANHAVGAPVGLGRADLHTVGPAVPAVDEAVHLVAVGAVLILTGNCIQCRPMVSDSK